MMFENLLSFLIILMDSTFIKLIFVHNEKIKQ